MSTTSHKESHFNYIPLSHKHFYVNVRHIQLVVRKTLYKLLLLKGSDKKYVVHSFYVQFKFLEMLDRTSYVVVVVRNNSYAKNKTRKTGGGGRGCFYWSIYL